MNKKGVGLFGIMIFLFLFIIAITVIGPNIKDISSDARSPDNLDCENSTLTIGERSTCIVVDLINPYFIAVIIAFGAAWIVKP